MRLRLLPLILLATATSPAQTPFPTELHQAVDAEMASLIELYHHLHRNPELSYQEKATSARMAAELKTAGFEVTTNVGGYGVVGVMKNGEGPNVLVRTDLDALPIVEATGVPYASKVKVKDEHGTEVGVMHACGHDVHMTVWTGTARMLARYKNRWQGTVIMVGQPAEERGGGARAMLEDGLYTRFPRPDYALALHVDAALEAGKVGWTSEYCLASVDSVDITVRGVGGHGAYPHGTKDPIVLAARIVLALQTIVSREVRPLDPAVVTVGSIHGGTKHNIIPPEVKMQLTVRCYKDEVREQIIAAIKRICEHEARSAGVPENLLPIVEVDDKERTPATYNDPELTKRAVASFDRYLGIPGIHIVPRDAEMGGEDFSRYSRAHEQTKGLMFRLGSVHPDKMAAAKESGTPLPTLHSPSYAPLPRPTITTGVRAMTGAVLDLMPRKK